MWFIYENSFDLGGGEKKRFAIHCVAVSRVEHVRTCSTDSHTVTATLVFSGRSSECSNQPEGPWKSMSLYLNEAPVA